MKWKSKTLKSEAHYLLHMLIESAKIKGKKKKLKKENKSKRERKKKKSGGWGISWKEQMKNKILNQMAKKRVGSESKDQLVMWVENWDGWVAKARKTLSHQYSFSVHQGKSSKQNCENVKIKKYKSKKKKKKERKKERKKMCMCMRRWVGSSGIVVGSKSGREKPYPHSQPIPFTLFFFFFFCSLLFFSPLHKRSHLLWSKGNIYACISL